MRVLIAMALACCVSVAFAQTSKPPAPSSANTASQQKANAGSSKQNPNSGGNTTATPTVIEISPSTVLKVEATDKTQRHHDYSSGEWWLVYLTAALVVVTFGLAVYTALLYRQTKRLASDAETTTGRQATEMANSIAQATRAAAAMEASVKQSADHSALAEKFSKRHMRAYVSVDFGLPTPQGLNLKFAGNPVFFNTGFTPARKVSYWVLADVLPTNLPDDYAFPQSVERITDVGLSPRQNHEIQGVVDGVYPDAELPEIMDGKTRRLYVWGVVRYEDIFEDHWETKFCHSFRFYQLPDGRRQADGAYHRTHNSAT